MKVDNIVNSIRQISREEAEILDSRFVILKMVSLEPNFISSDAKIILDKRFLILPDKEFEEKDINKEHLFIKYNQKYLYMYRIKR